MIRVFWIVVMMNALTYIFFRLSIGTLRSRGRLLAKGSIPFYNEVTYFIPGTKAWARKAFRFMDGAVEGMKVYVDYSLTGYQERLMAIMVMDDIEMKLEQGVDRVQIYAISLGEQVARRVKERFGDRVKVYLINPSTYLQGSAMTASQIGGFTLEIVSLLLGWLSLIPIIPTGMGRNYSLQLFADQLFALSNDRNGGKSFKVEGILLSDEDQFVDNAATEMFYPEGVPMVTIQSDHGNTIKKAEQYRQGMVELWEEVKKKRKRD